VRLSAFDTPLFSRIHSKVVLVDDAEAVVVSSPFTQSYWDTHTDGHHVFDAHRGSATGEQIPVHDVSLAVRGPAVKDMHDAYILHWNRNLAQADQIAPIDPPAALTTPDTGASIASLQLVRTINPGAFTDLPDGEQGVLEAYLRAIESAQNYIYLENQYFTNETIGKALVAALNDTKNRPNLQVIFLLNVTPDAPCYPGWQKTRINRIRTDAGTNAARIGFFTAWTHDPPAPSRGHSNPMIMANYLHTKLAIVDGKWATIGSANLDGTSLDRNEFLKLIQFSNYRNHELNYVMFNDIDGHPATDAIDNLRRALWGEHLGIGPADTRFDSDQAGKATGATSWLDLWQGQAKAKLTGLTTDPATIDPAKGRILEVPQKVVTNAQGFLTECQIDLTKLDLVTKTSAFNFSTGAWA
jgi:phosphatidylserine/phosphatidylglycerophosphate/cardiolipin synthase-like enzyme